MLNCLLSEEVMNWLTDELKELLELLSASNKKETGEM